MILSLTLNIALNKMCNEYNIVDVNNSSIEDIDHIIKICKKYNNTYNEMYYHVSDITLFITKLLCFLVFFTVKFTSNLSIYEKNALQPNCYCMNIKISESLNIFENFRKFKYL